MREKWNNRAFRRLLWPLVIEQALAITIGIADTVMVASVGEFAVSGVSLVDAINQLLIIAFSALATGGAVVVSQYIGRRNEKGSRLASRQLIYVSAGASLFIMLLSLILRRPILAAVYGNIAEDVMAAAETYFWLTAISYPFLAAYNAAASLFRSAGNSKITMLIAIVINVLNVAGTAVLIFVFRMGVAGAAISTLASRIVGALVLTGMLIADRRSPISLEGLFKVRLDLVTVRSILNVGVPNGLENSMFQFGKILLSRVFTTFGTAAIAANAISGSITSFSFMPANAFAIAMLTIVGQCIGAKEYDSAHYFTIKLMKLTHVTVIGFAVLTAVLMGPLIGVFNLSPEARSLAVRFLWVHCIMSPIAWPCSFTLPSALRAAGDSRFVMIVASISMWAVRVSFAYILAYPAGLGPIGVWIAMVSDWCVRAAFFVHRWLRGRWRGKQVLADG
ncbi:MAG: MATE family efflux transporter [Treponema sp.]|jgi:putative MATE family efflux protein|nr:MATE family efflux transporter [Treponema sp.]